MPNSTTLVVEHRGQDSSSINHFWAIEGEILLGRLLQVRHAGGPLVPLDSILIIKH
jgi:hypothetical protein